MINPRLRPFILVHLVSAIILVLLPYSIFEGRLFIGGDDTRMMYIFPYEYLKNMAFYSWFHVSSVGAFNPNHHAIPFMLLLTFLEKIIISRVVIDYFIFSLPLLLGYFFFQRLVNITIPNSNFFERFTGSIFYILSPILFVTQYAVFLYSVWLVGLIPMVCYFFIQYLITGKPKYILLNVLGTTLLAIGLYSFPWSLAFLLPTIISLLFVAKFYTNDDAIKFVKRGILFFGYLVLAHAFWLVPFVATFLMRADNSIGTTVLSSGVANTFRSTVDATAIGNVLYPMLNLFHRSLAFEFNWQLKQVFESFYDKFFWLNFIFIVTLLLGLKGYHTTKVKYKNNFTIFLLVAFLSSLFLFTVNIGPLREIFFYFGNIPGFVLFRNFYDKFSIAFVFYYAMLLTLCFVVIREKYQKIGKGILILSVLIIGINLLTIKPVVNSPLWTTQTSLRTIHFPQEYQRFLNEITQKVDPTATILGFPLNIASYSVIREDKTDNVYAGTSPVKILTGINDLTGDMSFAPGDTGKLNEAIVKKDFTTINHILEKNNLQYVLVTRNIPDQVRNSYLFQGGHKLTFQDDTVLKGIASDLVLRSEKGNYLLYKTKITSSLISGENVKFRRITPIHYEITISDLSKPITLYFNDSFHPGWKLFVSSGQNDFAPPNLMDISEFQYLTKQPLLESSHAIHNAFSNKWDIDPKNLQQAYLGDSSSQKTPDDLTYTLRLYFYPQIYFYIGSLISFVTIVSLFIYTVSRMIVTKR
jgi:hypothetical protein